MKIPSIVKSPRIRANTHIFAQKFAEGATREGVEIRDPSRLGEGMGLHNERKGGNCIMS